MQYIYMICYDHHFPNVCIFFAIMTNKINFSLNVTVCKTFLNGRMLKYNYCQAHRGFNTLMLKGDQHLIICEHCSSHAKLLVVL